VIQLRVRVTPGARETAIVGWQGDVLRVKVREKAEKGRANEAVIRLLADRLGVPPSAIVLRRGASGREKMLEVSGMGNDEMRHRLSAPVI
jgi:uncharacterized protein YggU (UPF0235/DUF167 family)